MSWYVIINSPIRVTLEESNKKSRLIVTFDEDGNPYVQRIYPCRACGWKQACGPNPGEDCHS